MKLARLLCSWEDDEGCVMGALEQEDLEVDHVQEGLSGLRPPRNYKVDNLRPLDGNSHRQEQPARAMRRPAAAVRAS